MSDDARTPRQIEADIEATRERLAATIDQLAYRTKPAVIVQRQKEQAQARLTETFTHDDGGVRVERVAAVAALVVGLVAVAILRRVRG